jgi:hypothetical protein
LGIGAACNALNVGPASFYRYRSSLQKTLQTRPEEEAPDIRLPKGRALSALERAEVLAELMSERLDRRPGARRIAVSGADLVAKYFVDLLARPVEFGQQSREGVSAGGDSAISLRSSEWVAKTMLEIRRSSI